jgi:hypothetical protein
VEIKNKHHFLRGYALPFGFSLYKAMPNLHKLLKAQPFADFRSNRFGEAEPSPHIGRHSRERRIFKKW